MDHLLAYSSETRPDWRENLVFNLAHCSEALEVAWIMIETLGDLVAMHAYGFVGVPHGESPVFQRVMTNLGGIPTWSETLSAAVPQREQDRRNRCWAAARCQTGSHPPWTPCNRLIADFYALHEATGAIHTLEESQAYSQCANGMERRQLGAAASLWRFI